jgi:hypothetical protein
MRVGIQRIAIVLCLALPCRAAHLSPSAQQAFDDYTSAVERRLAQQHAHPDSYLAVLNLGSVERTSADQDLRSGTLRIVPVNGGTREVAGGLLHHWRGEASVPNATAKEMLALLRDYNHLALYYAPEVESSRVLSERDGMANIAIRMRKQKVVTVVLDTEYEVQTGLTSASSGYSFSRSTHVWEVEDAGTSHEHRLAEGDDDGFLWRLNSYWSFVEVPGGLLIECEAVSLTRDIPTGLTWMIMPIIQEMPRESLEFTLAATRNALQSNSFRRAYR